MQISIQIINLLYTYDASAKCLVFMYFMELICTNKIVRNKRTSGFDHDFHWIQEYVFDFSINKIIVGIRVIKFIEIVYQT